MKSIEFKDKSAQIIYANYLKRVRRTISVLTSNDKKDILMEINSHIYEGMMSDQENTSEVEKLLQLTERLGDPEEVLKPLVADKKLRQATQTFNPKHVFQAIVLNIKNGIEYVIFALLYILIFALGLLTIFKIADPVNTGLFLEDGKFRVLGRSVNSGIYTEVLGNLFIPVVFFSAVALYMILTLILKRKRKRKKFAFIHSLTMYLA